MPSHRGKAQGTLAVRFQKKMDAALDKAERFLSFVADHCETVWDQEALVYLQSRGFECDDQITALFESWKADEQAVIDEYNQGIDTNDLSASKRIPSTSRRFQKCVCGIFGTLATMENIPPRPPCCEPSPSTKLEDSINGGNDSNGAL